MTTGVYEWLLRLWFKFDRHKKSPALLPPKAERKTGLKIEFLRLQYGHLLGDLLTIICGKCQVVNTLSHATKADIA